MIRPDIESLYFTCNREVSIQADHSVYSCVQLFLDDIRFIRLYNWNNWHMIVQSIQVQYMLISKESNYTLPVYGEFSDKIQLCLQGIEKETLHENVY